MSEKNYAIMPYDDYVEICDSVRNLTAAPDAIKSGEVAAAVYQGRNIRNAVFDRTITNITPNDLYGLTEIGRDAFSQCNQLKTATIPSGITFIGESAFSNCWELETINLPDGLKTINTSAFIGCSALKSIVLPSSLISISASAFSYCSALASITFPGTINKIANFSCHSCSSLATVILEHGIKSIGQQAFTECTSLTEVHLPDTLTTIDTNAFSNCFNLTDIYYEGSKEEWLNISIAEGNEPLYSATIHYAKASEPIGCDKLEFVSNGDGTCYVASRGECSHSEIEIPEKSPKGDTVTAIGANAFEGHQQLYAVILPDTVKHIGERAFKNCVNLESVHLGNSVEVISNYAFAYSGQVRDALGGKFQINLPNGLRRIGEQAFAYSQMDNIIIPESVTSIGDQAFVNTQAKTIQVDANNSVYHTDGNCLIETDTKTLLAAGINFTIPTNGTVIYIGNYAFDSFKFEEITIPDCITKIGMSAFLRCDKLTNVVLPKGLRIISQNAFFGCKSLVSIKIPENTIRIEQGAFAYCESLTSIEIPRGLEELEAIGDSTVFRESNNLSDIYYGGSLGEWERIAYNQKLSNVTIHCAIENPIAIFYPKDLFATIPTTSNNLTASVIDNNYITYTYITYNPSGEDPYYYPFSNITGGRYLNINYRTSTAVGMWLQIYLGSSGTGPSGPSQMLQIPLVTDGNWQTITFDLQELVNRGVYDGSHIAYFRFDVIDSMGNTLPSGCSLDVRYVAFFNTYEGTRQPESNFFNPNYIETATGPISTAFAYAGHIDILNFQGVDITGYRDKSSGTSIAKPGIISNFTAGSLNVDETAGDEKILVMKGWAVVNGGQDGYFWSVDGQNWTEVTRGTYGLAGPDIQAAGEAYGVTSFNSSYGIFGEIIIDVSSYKGQTIPNLYVAVRSKVAAGSPTQQKMCNFLTFTNLTVPA